MPREASLSLATCLLAFVDASEAAPWTVSLTYLAAFLGRVVSRVEECEDRQEDSLACLHCEERVLVCFGRLNLCRLSRLLEGKVAVWLVGEERRKVGE